MTTIATVKNEQTAKFIFEFEKYFNFSVESKLKKKREREFYTDFIFSNLTENEEEFVWFLAKADGMGY